MGVDFAQVLETDETTLARQQDPIFAHIIDRGDDPRTAHEIVLEARVNGTLLKALCGYEWSPTRNPEHHPICPKCEEILAFVKDFRNADDRPITG